MTTRALYLHVGTGKSGTSSLQAALWSSERQLAAAGVGLPLVGRSASLRKLVRPLGWAVSEGFTRDVDSEELQLLARRLKRTPGTSLLISNEDLAEAGTDQVRALREAASAAGLELRILVTARDWSKQIPSEYQQLLKHNLTTTYAEFLDQIRNHEGIGRQFWLRQDVTGICERWGDQLDPRHVHVIAVPSFEADPEAVYRLFSGVVGFDHHDLKIPDRDVNASYGVVEAEVLRRFNAALGDRLSDYEREYLPAVRRVLIRFAIARAASPRITLPPEHLDWVRDLAAERLERLREQGYTLHGDPSLLVPAVDAGRPLPGITEAQVAEAAIATLASFAVRMFREGQRATDRDATDDPEAPRRRQNR